MPQPVEVQIESEVSNLLEFLQLQEKTHDTLRKIFNDNSYVETLGGALLETRGVMKKLKDRTIKTFKRIPREDTPANIATRISREICVEELGNVKELSNRIIDE